MKTLPAILGADLLTARRAGIALGVVVASTLLGACGQKGPLYLPTGPAGASGDRPDAPASAPASEGTAQGASGR